ncbi:hypothetical protein NP233_g1646 [Leucocoprinus birnbaumii]|uniref:RWD domain-containing protein n=1 Tax=Leucocoprinus birnbaumii TaxID=56174 RepID=A0AAD5YXU1_9AGAR|nr:hypothetical protein NP233_g1646 [Leucocoprinus birnbaumii]
MQGAEHFTEAQQEEILALQSIYPDCVVIPSKKQPVLIFDIPVELPSATRLAFIAQGEDQTQDNVSLSHFPPITVTITLPSEYPDERPASIDYITAKSSWLSTLHLEQLEAHLFSLWQPGIPVLYEWLESICFGQFLTDLGLLSSNNLLRLQHPSPRVLLLQLSIYAQHIKSKQFAQANYDCPICLSPRKGGYWVSAINDGDPSRVGCPDTECIKAKREANVDDVQVVFNISRRISNLPSGVGPHESSEYEISMSSIALSAKKGICQSCKFSFCKTCKRTWHGPQNICRLTEEQLLRYVGDPEDNYGEPTSWMKALESEYGADNVRGQVDAFLPGYLKQKKFVTTLEERADDRYFNDFMEELDQYGQPQVWNKHTKASEQWIRKHTVPCPECKAPTIREPNYGCHMMQCICGEKFCWECGTTAENMRLRCRCYYDWDDLFPACDCLACH